nr:uncharacterized protein LOC108948654 [Nicotiana tomentosiformis]
MIQGSRQWHEKLPFALLGYCTTARTSVGATPYLLVYGTKAVIPAKVEIPSLRIVVESEIEDTKWVKKTRLEQLMLIDEKRLEAGQGLAVPWTSGYETARGNVKKTKSPESDTKYPSISVPL